jgi:four helix bundle protein
MTEVNKGNSIGGLRSRIKKFVLSVIGLAKKVPRDEVGRVFVSQLLRSATSIGANYEEASEAQTNKDLIYKLSVVKREARETGYWLDPVSEAYKDLNKNAGKLIDENDQLVKIFSSIIIKKKN